MKNLKVTTFLKSPKYNNITEEELNNFFATGYTRLLKERCFKHYTMFDYKQAILEANHLVTKDENRHTVDLMIFALAKIEDLEKTILDLEELINSFEKEYKQENNPNNEISYKED